MAAARKLQPNEVLFREGDPSDAMYVVKSGRLMIYKAKGTAEIELATIAPGQMLGEMAFFDQKPRSASAKAVGDAEVIALPFANLNAQFKTFPEWLKAMVKTINDHLREANKRIKNLEQATTEKRMFPPHTVTKLCAIVGLVAHRFGEADPAGGVVVPGGTLRNFTIQIFGEPTNRMQKLTEVLSALGLMKVEDLGEGRQKITVLKLDILIDFVNFYNEYLFKDESKRTTIEEHELKLVRGLLFYGRKGTPNDKGEVKISLNTMQNESMRDLGYVIAVNDVNSLISKGVTSDKMSEKDGVFVSFNLKELERILPFWEMIYTLDKVQR